MPRLAAGQLSKHPTKGFRVSVGTYLKDGAPTEKVFWLGHNEQAASFAAHTYRTGWAQLRAAGYEHWTDDLIGRAKATIAVSQQRLAAMFEMQAKDQEQLDRKAERLEEFRSIAQPLSTSTSTPAADAAPVGSSGVATLYRAIDAYLTAFKAKRHSDAHKWRAEQIVRTTLKRLREDCPLSQIDYVWLDRLCDYFKARPASLKNGKPLSPETVVTTLRYLRAFFMWLDDSGFGGWEGPRKLARPFRVRREALMTPGELKDAATIRQFDLPTLRKLYSAATDTQKALMLTAIFTGGTQNELAVLERREFDLNAGLLTHFRNKTHIEGRFWLPAELVKLLRAEFKSRPGDTLAFRTEDGNPLVSFKGPKKVSDAVRLSWDRLRDRAEVPDALSFKYLRKYIADWMTRKAGDTMGQVALSHARQTVLAKNYTTARDFDTFNRLQQEMYAEMKAARFFEKLTKEEIEAERKAVEQQKEKSKQRTRKAA